MPVKRKIYLVDCHALLYRAFWALIKRPLVTTTGENTSAVYGFMRMILRLIKDENPEYMVCVFDSKKKTFRHEIYKEYKANRLKPPEDLNKQIEFTRKLLEGLGLPVLIKEGYEADDVMGTLAGKISNTGDEAIIVSGDKDVLQLVDSNIKVYTVKRGISEMEIMDAGKIKQEWGVEPNQVIDVLALMGDQADNIPGVKGIGEKTALQLISKFGSIESLYDNLDKIDRESLKKKLMEGKEKAFLSKKLIIIKKDVPINLDLEMLRIKDFPGDSGIEMLKEKELNTIVAELKPELQEETEKLGKETTLHGKYHVVSSLDGLESVKRKILNSELLSIDTETTGKDAMDSELIGISLCVKEGEGYYIPIKGIGVSNGMEMLESIKPLLENKQVKKIGQNIKYDILVLRNNGVELSGVEGDTFIAAYLLDPQKQRYRLDELAKEFLNYQMVSYGDVVKNKGETLLDYSIDEVAKYSCEDADVALRLYKIMKEKLEKNGLYDLYREIEVPLVSVLARMEYWGVKVDTFYLEKMSKKFDEELNQLEEEIYYLVGERFNIRSTKQLAEILFDKMKIPPVKKTKTGFSTDESVLEELAGKYEVAKLLLRHRRLSKLKSTYIDSLPNMVNKKTGRIHTSFNQTITTTGRLSSSNPNLQNIPIREEEGRAIRQAFIPEDGWYILSADYSQIELRILASLSGDPSLMEAFIRDGDVHRETASILFGVKPEEVTDEQRSAAKTINFSIIYGISPYGLAQRLNISKTEAAFFIEMYFQKYNGVKKFFDRLVEKVKQNGYVETLLGRRRYIPGINSKNKNIFESARRIAINTPIQGTAADLIKKAMVCIDAEIIRRKLRTKMLIQVHDELVFEVPEDELEETSKMVKTLMESAIEFNVPIKVNIAYGKNWEEAH